LNASIASIRTSKHSGEFSFVCEFTLHVEPQCKSNCADPTKALTLSIKRDMQRMAQTSELVNAFGKPAGRVGNPPTPQLDDEKQFRT